MGIFDNIKAALGIGQSEPHSAVFNERPSVQNYSAPFNLSVPDGIQSAISHAQDIGTPVQTEMNGVKVFVDGQSDAKQAYAEYGQAKQDSRASTMNAQNPAYQRHTQAQADFSIRPDVLATSESTRDMSNPLAYNIDPKSFDFSPENCTPVISNAQKFILPIPALQGGGEPLVHPNGDKQGQPITDWQGNPIAESGVVFSNPKDQSTQAVQGDGSGVIIMNEVTAEQANKLTGKINSMGGDPNAFSIDQVKEVLDYAKNDVGLKDMYNSDKGFVSGKMNQIEMQASGIEAYGMHRRDDRDVCQASFVSECGQFTGSQTTHTYNNGGVILQQGDDIRLIQPEEFERTYTHPDGSAISRNDLAQQGNERNTQTGLTAANQAIKDSAETGKAALTERVQSARSQVDSAGLSEQIRAGCNAPAQQPSEKAAPQRGR